MLLSEKLLPAQLVKYLLWALFVFSAGAFAHSHHDARPSQWAMSVMVWLLPLVYLLKFPRQLNKGEWLLLISGAALFLSTLVSFAWSGDLWEPGVLRTYWLYLLPIGLVPLLAALPFNKRGLYVLLMLSMALSFAVVLKDLSTGVTRAAHHGLAIPYGSISLTTALICFIFSQDKSVSSVWRTALFLAGMLGLVGVVWSQTRGAWVYFLIWILVALVLWFRRESSRKRKLAVLGGGVVLILMIALFPAGDLVRNRAVQAVNEVADYMGNKSSRTSSGQRLELWKVASESFSQSPLLGAGISGFVSKRDEMQREKRIDMIKPLKHSHNDVLWMLATRGAVGGVVLLGFYFALYRYYYARLSAAENRLLAYAGLTALGGAVVYGITDIYISLKITLGYFLILNALLIRLLKDSGSGTQHPAGG